MELDPKVLFGVILEKVDTWLKIGAAMLPNLVVAALLLVMFWFLGKLLRQGVESILDRATHNRPVSRLVAGTVNVFTVLIGFFVSLGVLSLDKTVTSLLAGAGVIGLALGFAFQEIASNFIAGILIAFMKPYGVGDTVKVDTHLGVVGNIDLRTTRIHTFDGLEVIMPNKDMFTKPITNYTTTPFRRAEILGGVSYAEDLRKVEQIARTALQKVSVRATEKDIEFFYTAFGESAVNFMVRIWVKNSDSPKYLQVIHESILVLKEAFDQNHIAIPFPITTLDFGIKGGVSLADSGATLAKAGVFPVKTL